MHIGRRTVTRAGLGAGLGAAVATGLAGCQDEPRPGPVRASLSRQVGVDRPVPRPAHLDLRVVDLRPGPDPRDALGRLGPALAAAVADEEVTCTVGLSPALVRHLAPDLRTGVTELPRFAREDVRAAHRQGDVVVQLCADDPDAPARAWARLRAPYLRRRWGQRGHRGQVDGPGARNLLGFYDGIAVPETAAALDDGVWTQPSDGLAGATVCVVRRMRLDAGGFAALPVGRQEAAVGRRRDSGAPLSGGGPTSDVNLQAKSASGDYDVALAAHARRAHPFVSGAQRLMMRRSYSYDNGPADRGVVFISFQRSLDIFTATQRSLDALDDLSTFAVTTATGTWLVPPWDGRGPLSLI